MSDRSQQMLCKALELAENAVDFYDATLASCAQGLGHDVFSQLKDDKVAHMNRLKEVHDNLAQGQTWIDACLLPAEDAKDVSAAFKAMADKYDPTSCPASEEAALEKAISMEKAILAFYQESQGQADDEVEKQFLVHIIGDVRNHTILLADMQYYYEDPEAWARGEGRGGLDGA
ncbi:MAG: hypothetical protein D6E12_10525 [Desulfovibrio sp.]|nr:MAG: hypothetical protein D6E12_10525 [Desulfovibrio sp.]